MTIFGDSDQSDGLATDFSSSFKLTQLPNPNPAGKIIGESTMSFLLTL